MSESGEAGGSVVPAEAVRNLRPSGVSPDDRSPDGRLASAIDRGKDALVDVTEGVRRRVASVPVFGDGPGGKMGRWAGSRVGDAAGSAVERLTGDRRDAEVVRNLSEVTGQVGGEAGVLLASGSSSKWISGGAKALRAADTVGALDVVDPRPAADGDEQSADSTDEALVDERIVALGEEIGALGAERAATELDGYGGGRRG